MHVQSDRFERFHFNTVAGRYRYAHNDMADLEAQLQAAGGSFVMLAKGNRSAQVTEACKAYGAPGVDTPDEWRLHDFALVAFVSPNAIDAAFAHIPDFHDTWPAGVTVAVVGEGSRAALARRMRAHWVRFVREGRPGDDWKPFDATKRATLLFKDQERLKAILNRWDRPMQIVFAVIPALVYLAAGLPASVAA